jgi:hypothetical protein
MRYHTLNSKSKMVNFAHLFRQALQHPTVRRWATQGAQNASASFNKATGAKLPDIGGFIANNFMGVIFMVQILFATAHSLTSTTPQKKKKLKDTPSAHLDAATPALTEKKPKEVVVPTFTYVNERSEAYDPLNKKRRIHFRDTQECEPYDPLSRF